MRALFSSLAFTIPVFAAVVITSFFAFVFDAPPQLVVTMLVLGVFTAVMEYTMRSGQGPS